MLGAVWFCEFENGDPEQPPVLKPCEICGEMDHGRAQVGDRIVALCQPHRTKGFLRTLF